MEDLAKEQSQAPEPLAKADDTAYDKFVDEVFALDGTTEDKVNDSDVIVAKVVEKLRVKYPKHDTQLLYDKARDLYWEWRDSRSGEEEFTSTVCD